MLCGYSKRKLDISKDVKIAAKCFLKRRLPFMYNLNIWMPKKINMMNMRCANQRFSLGFKLGKKDYKRASKIK